MIFEEWLSHHFPCGSHRHRGRNSSGDKQNFVTVDSHKQVAGFFSRSRALAKSIAQYLRYLVLSLGEVHPTPIQSLATIRPSLTCLENAALYKPDHGVAQGLTNSLLQIVDVFYFGATERTLLAHIFLKSLVAFAGI